LREQRRVEAVARATRGTAQRPISVVDRIRRYQTRDFRAGEAPGTALRAHHADRPAGEPDGGPGERPAAAAVRIAATVGDAAEERPRRTARLHQRQDGGFAA